MAMAVLAKALEPDTACVLCSSLLACEFIAAEEFPSNNGLPVRAALMREGPPIGTTALKVFMTR